MNTRFLNIACIFAVIFLIPHYLFPQLLTIEKPGNWNDVAIWKTSDVADNINENVDIKQNTGNITVSNTYLIGSVEMNNGNMLTIESGASLLVGQAGNLKNFSIQNSGTIVVNGTLDISGNLYIGNTLSLIVHGTFIVRGNLVFGNNSSLTVSGNAIIYGNVSGSNNTNLIVDGSLAVGGSISVGSGSTASGTGIINVMGPCTGSDAFCLSTILPVSLIDFIGTNLKNEIKLSFSTLSEKNFDYFVIERSADAKNYTAIGTVKGSGWSQDRKDYKFTDKNPLPGLNYYRLKAVDLDGYAEYFPPVSVFNNNTQVQVFTMVRDKILLINSNINASVNLIGMSGLKAYSGNIVSGSNELKLPESTGKGLYTVIIFTEQNVVKRTKVYVE